MQERLAAGNLSDDQYQQLMQLSLERESELVTDD
jgi:uncharacterized membrane protein